MRERCAAIGRAVAVAERTRSQARLRVYALVKPPVAKLRMRGVDNEPLNQITVGAVSAVVGERRNVQQPTSAVLARYAAIVGRIGDRTAAIVPARFATEVTSVDELTSILRLRQPGLARTLRHVRNRVQMTVRVIGLRKADPPKPARRTSGTTYLRDRATTATLLHVLPGIEPVRAAIKRWVRDERVDVHERVTTVYHLIPRQSAVAYARAIEAAAERAGVRAIVSGPWPPYAFSEA